MAAVIEPTGQLALAVTEQSQVGEARRRAHELARAAGFDDVEAGRAAIVVTEAGTNLVRHGGGGELLLRPLGLAGGLVGIELMTVDRGPGMTSVAASMRDGHSTAGSPGQGLGAISRAARDLEIWSQPGMGTVLRCEIWPHSAAPERGPQVGGVCIAKAGEAVSGDDWTLVSERGRHALMVVDGLGHGPDAAAAARAAVGVFARSRGSAGELLGIVHDALRSTRGAAASVALVQPAKGILDYAGIGNVSGVIRSDSHGRHLMSTNGILGHASPKIHELSYPFPTGSLLIMHSDGLATRWDLGKYAGLEAKHPAIIAGVLWRDHTRERDDVTVAVMRNTTGG